ncbi:MAG: sulfite exporter TauE/SafE family protein [Hyphomicrobiales bacterium]|nr:sulfite exporter TauE/SafE family protein [Hyphomicrobiales bacterium]
MLEIILIAGAGFICGCLNAIAGGGTFVTLPALIWVGIPPIAANATATATAVPGYCASVWAYRKDIRAEGSLRLEAIILLAAAGGVVGAVLLILTSSKAFAALVPWLLLTATTLFAVAPDMLKLLRTFHFDLSSPAAACLILLGVTTYGGYFNGGLGIIILAALSLQGYRNLHGMNGLKNLLSSILSIMSVITFMSADVIVWEVAAPMAAGNVLGAYLASRIVRKIRQVRYLRQAIIAIGSVMTAVFFIA